MWDAIQPWLFWGGFLVTAFAAIVFLPPAETAVFDVSMSSRDIALKNNKTLQFLGWGILCAYFSTVFLLALTMWVISAECGGG